MGLSRFKRKGAERASLAKSNLRCKFASLPAHFSSFDSHSTRFQPTTTNQRPKWYPKVHAPSTRVFSLGLDCAGLCCAKKKFGKRTLRIGLLVLANVGNEVFSTNQRPKWYPKVHAPSILRRASYPQLPDWSRLYDTERCFGTSQ